MPTDATVEHPDRDLMPLLIDVQHNLDQEISLASLARRYGYSPFHFHVTSPLPGSLRKDPPGKVLYLGVADITATLATIEAHGDAPSSPRMEVPGVAVLALFTDPAGNRMGLIEMNGGTPKVP